MKRYSAAVARSRLAEVLDLAERGDSVIIERRGIRFVVRVQAPKKRKRAPKRPRIEILDAAVESGQWSWAWSDANVELVDRRPSSKKPKS